jgi:hypothetical protein
MGMLVHIGSVKSPLNWARTVTQNATDALPNERVRNAN